MRTIVGIALFVAGFFIVVMPKSIATKTVTYPLSVCTYETRVTTHAVCEQSGPDCVGTCWKEFVDWAYCQFNYTSSCTKELLAPSTGQHIDYACEDNGNICACNWNHQIGTSFFSTVADRCL